MAYFCTECGKAVQPDANFCNNCGMKLVQIDQSVDSRRNFHFEDKRARVIGNNHSGNKPKFILFSLVGALLIFGMVTLFNSLPSRANPVIEQQPVVSGAVQYPESPTQMKSVQARTENGKIILPLEKVFEKKFVAYEYQSPRGVIPLLAYISPQGKVVTAVSMCEPCNSTRFHIRSDELICNSCGTTWELDNLAGVSGACQNYPPDPVPNIVSGNEIRIDETAVASWTPRK